jgi:hypothetical protein
VPKRFAVAAELQLNELDSYHQDVEASLRLYFSPSAATFAARFVGKRLEEVKQELKSRIDESDIRSTFFILTSLEASLRVDFEHRCQKRLKDALSREFRKVKKERKYLVRLDEDILEGWKRHWPALSRDIAELRSAVKFRHLIAHGRYWTPKPGKFDFRYVREMAERVIIGFAFQG